MPIYMNYTSKLTQQVLQNHTVNRLQARGLSPEGALKLAQGQLPTQANDLARLSSEFGPQRDSRLLLPSLADNLNVHPGGVNFHPGGANLPNFMPEFAGPGGGPHLTKSSANDSQITDGTSNTILFGEKQASASTAGAGRDPRGIIAILIGL